MNLTPLMHALRTVFSIDLRTLALFRVCLGLMVIADLILRSFDLTQFYTDSGILSRATWLKITSPLQWSLHAASGQTWFQILLFLIAAISAVGLIVGYRTRLMTFICWALTVSLINRNGYVLQGGDELLVLMLFWAMFLPLNARFSIDSALALERRGEPNNNSAAVNAYFSVATIAIILQVLYLYFFTALMKTGAPWRVDMTAAFYAVNLQHIATPIGSFVSQFPSFMAFGTWSVMIIEFIGPIIAISPWFHLPLRIVALMCFYGLHFAFLLMLHIGLFPLIDFAALTILIPGAIWTWLATSAKRRSRSNIRLYYDEGCGFCIKMCLIVRELLLPSSAKILPAQQHPDIYPIMQAHNSWVVTNTQGDAMTRWQAMQFLFQQSPLFKPLGLLMKLPLLMRQGDKVYETVANSRDKLGLWSERALPYKIIRLKPRLMTQLVAGFFLYIITWVNLTTVPGLDLPSAQHVDVAKRVFRVDQRWDMFAPYPLTYSLYPVVLGNLRNGQKVDLLQRSMNEPSFEPPDYIYPVYEGYRWRKYIGRINSYNADTIRQGYGSYLCRNWNHPGRPREQQLATAEIHFVRLDTNTKGLPKKKSQRRAWQHWCYAEFAPKK